MDTSFNRQTIIRDLIDASWHTTHGRRSYIMLEAFVSEALKSKTMETHSE
jgi:hypothetical protein